MYKVGGAYKDGQARKMSYAPKNAGWIISGLKNVIDRPLDPTLVDSTHKLLDILNKAADRLPKLLNKRDERGYTLLHFAAERNQPESLKCLLIKEGEPSNRILATAKMHDDFNQRNCPGVHINLWLVFVKIGSRGPWNVEEAKVRGKYCKLEIFTITNFIGIIKL